MACHLVYNVRVNNFGVLGNGYFMEVQSSVAEQWIYLDGQYVTKRERNGFGI